MIASFLALFLVLTSGRPVAGQEQQLDPALIEQMKPQLKSSAPAIVRFGETELQFIGTGSEGMYITQLPVVRTGDEPVRPDQVRVEARYVTMDGRIDDPGAQAAYVEEENTSRAWRTEPVNWTDQQQELLETTCEAPPGTEVIGFVAVLIYGDTVQDALIRGSESYNLVLAEKLGFLMGNTLADAKFQRKPFNGDNTAAVGSQIKWQGSRYHWEHLEGEAQSDLIGSASFLRDGRDPVVEVRKRISNPQEVQLAPTTEPRPVVPEKRDVQPATVFEP